MIVVSQVWEDTLSDDKWSCVDHISHVTYTCVLHHHSHIYYELESTSTHCQFWLSWYFVQLCWSHLPCEISYTYILHHLSHILRANPFGHIVGLGCLYVYCNCKQYDYALFFCPSINSSGPYTSWNFKNMFWKFNRVQGFGGFFISCNDASRNRQIRTN